MRLDRDPTDSYIATIGVPHPRIEMETAEGVPRTGANSTAATTASTNPTPGHTCRARTNR